MTILLLLLKKKKIMVLLPRVATSVLNVLMLHPQVISLVKSVRLLVLYKHDPSPQ